MSFSNQKYQRRLGLTLNKFLEESQVGELQEEPNLAVEILAAYFESQKPLFVVVAEKWREETVGQCTASIAVEIFPVWTKADGCSILFYPLADCLNSSCPTEIS